MPANFLGLLICCSIDMCYFKLLLWLQGILCYLQVSSCQDLNGLYLQHILESECIHVDVGNHFSIAILGGIYK